MKILRRLSKKKSRSWGVLKDIKIARLMMQVLSGGKGHEAATSGIHAGFKI